MRVINVLNKDQAQTPSPWIVGNDCFVYFCCQYDKTLTFIG